MSDSHAFKHSCSLPPKLKIATFFPSFIILPFPIAIISAIFGKQFPDRMFDVGIAEQHAITFAAGLATEGYKP